MAKKNDKMAALRREYSELRKIGRKRMQRMSQSEFNWTQTFQRNFYTFYTKYQSLRSLGNISRGDLAKLVRDLKVWLGSKETSVSGLKQIRRESIQTLHDNGYKFVNISNYKEWTQFLDWWHETHPKNYKYPTREEMKSYLDNVNTKGMTKDEAQEAFESYERSQNNKARGV